LQPLLLNMVFTPKMIFMFVLVVQSAKQNRRLIRPRKWEGKIILIFPVSRTPVMKELISGFEFNTPSPATYGATSSRPRETSQIPCLIRYKKSSS
jgi:hypothetical protein